MTITFDQKHQVFHLTNEKISYVLGILRNGHLGHFYFGSKLPEGEYTQNLFRRDENRGLTNYVYEGDMSFSLNLERLEYPCFGTTDYRTPAIDIVSDRGSSVLDFAYKTHRVMSGKKPLEGLPATRAGGHDALTLEIELEDPVLEAILTLSYTIFDNYPAIARSAKITNKGKASFLVKRLMSLSIDFMDAQWQMTELYGDWTRERHVATHGLHPGIQSIGSLRGASSAAHNPFMMLSRAHTTEQQGEAIGFSLVYSGNFLMQTEVNADDKARITTGIHPQGFAWTLNSGETFQSPEAIIAYSDQGIGALSRTFHDLFRTHLIPERWRHETRPILLNNWEATYFDFDETKILDLAKGASALGIEMLVLDDGWFGVRNDDKCGLGDWAVNTDKLPSGIQALSRAIHEAGIKFGLWIEPEMINKGTRLYEAHPDWLIGDPLRKRSHGRNQYVLDYSRPEVVDGIFNQLIQVFDGASIDYIKWDMNRNITEAFSVALPAERQGELLHRYILGVYDLYERMTNRYPHILFESCSAGGARFDPGLLYYAPQAWTSDDTDAVERLKIQYGTSMAYPLSSMGSHVSDIPNHQVKRQTPLKMRGDVAYFGTFGYELNILKMPEDVLDAVKAQITFFKAHRQLIHQGDFYRLLSPFEKQGNQTAWMVASKDGKEALAAYYQVLARPNDATFMLKLQGLVPEASYRVSGYDEVLSGSYLMQFGLRIKPSFNGIEYSGDVTGDYQSRLWKIERLS